MPLDRRTSLFWLCTQVFYQTRKWRNL